MKITTGRQLLEWLKDQPESVLESGLVAHGEETPYSFQIHIRALKQDIYQDDECSAEESDMLGGYSSLEEMQENCKKIIDKGGIIISI